MKASVSEKRLANSKLLTRQRQWQLKHPEKRLAHEIVRRALLRGLLAKQPCEDCGALQVDAHHDDYSRPLIVVWLCRLHHMRRHARKITKGPGVSRSRQQSPKLAPASTSRKDFVRFPASEVETSRVETMTPAERNGLGVRQSLPDANPDTVNGPTLAATPVSDTKVAPVPLGDDVPPRRGKAA